MVKKFVENTKDGQRVELLDVFELEREGEASGFNPLKLDNHKLLWHGSRFSNYVGILS